jgi:hypothetical protein
MTPGIDTDSMIARKVWRAIVVSDGETGENYMVGQDNHDHVPIPKFSTEIDEAHKVVEMFQTKGWTFRVRSLPEDDAFEACFYREDSKRYRFSKSATMPMAICEAALAALTNTNVVISN